MAPGLLEPALTGLGVVVECGKFHLRGLCLSFNRIFSPGALKVPQHPKPGWSLRKEGETWVPYPSAVQLSNPSKGSRQWGLRISRRFWESRRDARVAKAREGLEHCCVLPFGENHFAESAF